MRNREKEERERQKQERLERKKREKAKKKKKSKNEQAPEVQSMEVCPAHFSQAQHPSFVGLLRRIYPLRIRWNRKEATEEKVQEKEQDIKKRQVQRSYSRHQGC